MKIRNIVMRSIACSLLSIAYVNAAEVSISNVDFDDARLLNACKFEVLKKERRRGDYVYDMNAKVSVALPKPGDSIKANIPADQYDDMWLSCPGITVVPCMDTDGKQPWKDKGINVKASDGLAISLISVPHKRCVFVNASEFERK